ncbi:hypothetical protein M9H77_29546 [Catharanthus roseus]|uniref:Uncharacterized protein n=1 Tax=Catharanthus roseus TaxID=4058 RepID=A0ACB9ZV28_CATRO|nr:hypothetical protein M9H77_29546 [Catharanthus roseus]
MVLESIKTWSLMKQALRIRCGVENHKGLVQGQAKIKFMEPSKNEESPKSEHLECSKENESELEKSEKVKENECFIEKQDSEKEEQRIKEIVVLEESKEVNLYANGTNSFFASESLCVRNFEDSRKNEGGKLAYNSFKTLNFFPSNSYLSFEIYFKEIKFFSLVFIENGYQFYFLNSLGNLLEKKYFIEFNSLSYFIPRVNEYCVNFANYSSCVLGIEHKGMSIEKELGF